jgi:hypothetical protein
MTGPPGAGTDTSERRRYTLIADTFNGSALVDAHVVSNVYGEGMAVNQQRVVTTWKRSFWVGPDEVISINLGVWTYGTHPRGTAPWARCQILLNDGMRGGDAEVDQLPVVRRREDNWKQAHAICKISAG